jgi:hypothetical protein
MVFNNERRTKPLRIRLGVLTNPFTRPLSQRPNERKRLPVAKSRCRFCGRGGFIAYGLCLQMVALA